MNKTASRSTRDYRGSEFRGREGEYRGLADREFEGRGYREVSPLPSDSEVTSTQVYNRGYLFTDKLQSLPLHNYKTEVTSTKVYNRCYLYTGI